MNYQTMNQTGINIGGRTFSGPYTHTGYLMDRAGVYVILSRRLEHDVIDVGESTEIKTRVENHDRKHCWQRNANGGTLFVAVLYTPGWTANQRRLLEKAIREQYTPPCGER